MSHAMMHRFPLQFTNRRPTAPALLATALLLVLAGCAPLQWPMLDPSALRRDPVRITGGVRSSPGAVAWSPDGRHLAFISGGSVRVIDPPSVKQRKLALRQASALAWSPGGELFVLAQEEGRSALYIVEQDRDAPRRLPIDRQADMLYALDDKTLVLASVRAEHTRIGIQVAQDAAHYTLASGATASFYSFNRFFTASVTDGDLFAAWLHGGLNPLDRSFLIIEPIKPPMLAPYSRVSCVDTFSEADRQVTQNDRSGIYVSGCWSPDGRRIALVNRNSRIELWEPKARSSSPLPSPPGRYASWNPRGSDIFFGGWILSSSGGSAVPLILNAPASLGIWSPDGTQLAVAAHGQLLLFKHFSPFFSGSDQPLDPVMAERVRQLGRLVRDGLLPEKEYSERRGALLREAGGCP